MQTRGYGLSRLEKLSNSVLLFRESGLGPRFHVVDGAAAHVAADAYQRRGDKGLHARGLAQPEGEHAGEGAGNEFADQLHEVEGPGVAGLAFSDPAHCAPPCGEKGDPGIRDKAVGRRVFLGHRCSLVIVGIGNWRPGRASRDVPG